MATPHNKNHITKHYHIYTIKSFLEICTVSGTCHAPCANHFTVYRTIDYALCIMEASQLLVLSYGTVYHKKPNTCQHYLLLSTHAKHTFIVYNSFNVIFYMFL